MASIGAVVAFACDASVIGASSAMSATLAAVEPVPIPNFCSVKSEMGFRKPIQNATSCLP